MLPAVEILGLFAGFLTAFSSVPQAIKIIKTRDAKSVSAGTYAMLVGSYLLWLIYGVVQGAFSIIFWNIIGLALGGVVLFLKLVVWKENLDEGAKSEE